MTLVGHWPLHEDGGSTAHDMTGNQNNGSHVNNPTPGATGVLGNTSYRFNDADSEYVDITNYTGPTGSFSISCWVNLDTLSSNKQFFGTNDDNNADGFWLEANTGTGNPWRFAIREGGTNYFADGGSASTGSWFHIVGTWDEDSQTMRNYENGVEVATNSPAISYNGGWGTRIGYVGFNYLDGRLCECRIYDHALSASEVQYLYDTINYGNHVSSKKTL